MKRAKLLEKRLHVLMDTAMFDLLELWRRGQIDIPSRGEAIRRMINRVLVEDGYLEPSN
jgi:hypothetical protein